MLTVGNGDLWLMSTPYGKRGFFYEAWAYGDGWERHTAPATECPRILPAFLEEERSAMGQAWFRRSICVNSLTRAAVGSAARWSKPRSATTSRYGCKQWHGRPRLRGLSSP
jgi:hypothetical protein